MPPFKRGHQRPLQRLDSLQTTTATHEYQRVSNSASLTIAAAKPIPQPHAPANHHKALQAAAARQEATSNAGPNFQFL
jgi:hypothetical protein